jgi:thioester reductase-like protein
MTIANDPLASSQAARLRSELRTYALTQLPRAMVPAHFVVLRELPTLPNGKIDRKSLPPLVTGVADHVAPRTPGEAQIAAIWQDLLGISRASVETSFFELGGDSLSMLQMSARVGEAYQLRLDMSRLLEQPTIAQLARMVGAQTCASPDGELQTSQVDLLAEAVLPDDVVAGAAIAPGAPQAMLVTEGASWLGAFLIRELLDRSAARIYAITRATSDAAATVQVHDGLAARGLARPGDERRITGIAGDLARPYLGLSRPTYLELAARADVIFHDAVEAHWTAPYARHKPVNVLGGVEVLRLACRTRTVPVHFVSSTAVQAGLPEALEIELDAPDHLAGGYRQSAWVIDKLMSQAGARGVPTYTYRIGELIGAGDTLLTGLIRGSIQLGAIPDCDLRFSLVPVDHCAQVVAHVALASGASPGVFHVPGARAVSLIEIAAACGYPLRRLDYPAWRRLLIESGADHPFARYLGLFGIDQPTAELGIPGHHTCFSTTRLRAALAGSGIAYPELTPAVWQRHLESLLAP